LNARVSTWREIWARFQGRGAYPHQLAFLLRIPLRELVFSRRRLVALLRLESDSRVLEIGPGPGFFSAAVARAVPAGGLALLDLQREMLRKARRHVQRAGLSNVHFACGSAAHLPYRPATFDRVFLVAVLGEVPDPTECVREIARVLRPGGRLVITELPGDPDALSQADLQAMVEPFGFRSIDCVALRGGYSIVLERQVTSSPRSVKYFTPGQ